jgi:hypothetical protein
LCWLKALRACPLRIREARKAGTVDIPTARPPADVAISFGDTMNRFTGALSSDAIGELQREFTPDMKRLFRKHAPKEIRKIEDKSPIPADDKP